MNSPATDDAITLLSDIRDDDGADITFKRVVDRIREASESIHIHMFVWRNDEIGNEIGREILGAADRDVKVHIKKDVGAFMYERIEMNRKSFFNRRIPLSKRLTYAILTPTFPNTFVEDDFDYELGQKVMEHANVSIEWVNHTHTKYYIFDDRIMITGSINIEDRHRKYRDTMVEIQGEEFVERFRRRDRDEVPHDATRTLDFVLNDASSGRFEIKSRILDLLSKAERSVYVEMAYIGDPAVSEKLIETANRGVRLTVLFSEKANIGNDINYRSLHRLYERASFEVYLTPKMIHSKMILIDDEIVILGSANISIFSMQKATELDVVVRDNPTFLEAVRKNVAHRIQQSKRVRSAADLGRYNRTVAFLQQLHQKLT